ncbi:unnamed protein product [Aureobasidium uvarum]|uniref:P-loop containing nucleoside triphosphate hydrolase protein n=1 Tax=Aureobasidium uvarum TaxID=2773716 RepID=A0A9N8PXV7_9PEZI|nr:unnamed protein product [Aureobasidium uvarum]
MAEPRVKLEIVDHASAVSNHNDNNSAIPSAPQSAPSDDTSTMAATTPAPGAFNTCNTQDQARQDNDPQLDLLGRPVQKLVQLIKDLEQLGVETRNLPLPKIVVVGDQSAGKSSLIEGISGIKVPRSDGTCTRCPLEITLFSSEDAAWSCKVSLQQRFTFDSEADPDGRYGKWREDHAPTTIDFAVVHNKDELEGVLSRAQRATLNPGDNLFEYLNASSVDDMLMKVEFSPNKVVLAITAPGQPSLSFIDLPGVIRQMTTAADKWLVKLVENFVADHIEQGNSLILLARSMESDFANSSGAALIDQHDGALARTVGCLTKPDRWPVGSKTQLIKNVLKGDAFAVGHGYFVTKQPNQLELNNNISADDARRSEVEFFAQDPWTTELHDFQDRFGTFKLRDTLSVKLTKQILVTLPRITRMVDARVEEVETELTGYPDPPENALGKVLEALTTFRITVEKHSQGVHPYNEMHNSLKDLANTFHANLQGLRPGLVVATPETFRQAIEAPTFSLLSDDDEGGGTPCPSVEPSKSNKKRRAEFNTPTTSTAKKIKSDVATPRNSSAPTTMKKTFRLLEVRETLSKLTASSVPGGVDPLAVDHLRKQTLAGWAQPMLEFINSVHQEIQSTLDQLLEEACAQWLNTAFFSEARKIVKAFVVNAMRDQLQQAKRALDLEQRKPLTLNTEGFKHHHDKELQILQDGRTTQRLVEKLENADRAAGKILVDQTERKKKARTDVKARAELGDDPFAEEIKVMAKVGGYHNVALLRFLDHVVQGIQAEVLHELETNLMPQLKAGLEVETRDAQERCKELLAEDREREIRRKELQKERTNFIEAQRKLAAIGLIGEDVASLTGN